MKNIVVLISGSGSNLQAIIDACGRKQINGTLRAVFSNKADAFGLERARLAGIPAHALAQSQFADREAFDRQLMHEIDAYAPDLVVLAGYMRILSPAFVSHYQGRLLNIHPSLLPKYPACILIVRCWRTVTRSTAPRCTSSPMSWTVGRLFCRPRCRSSLATARRKSRRGFRPRNMPFIRWSSAGSSMDVCAWQATTPGWMSDSFPRRAMPPTNEQPAPHVHIAGLFF